MENPSLVGIDFPGLGVVMVGPKILRRVDSICNKIEHCILI